MPPARKSTYQVIHELPDSATPWQQDSAVQAYFRPGADNHYSERPDTLGLPGQRAERPEGVLPLDSLSRPEAYVDTLPAVCRPAVATGLVAEPRPYSAAADPLVSALVMGGLLVALLAIASSGRFVGRMARNFLYTENDRTTAVPDTAAELRGQGWLVAFTCLMLAIVAASYSRSLGGTVIEGGAHLLLALYAAAVVAYFALKATLYQVVNWVFFDRKKSEQWNKALLCITAVEGLAFAPAVLLHVFGGIPLPYMLLAVGFVAILAKLLTFYKCYLIFFGRVGALLQIILYFCALELIPLAGLAGLMQTMDTQLKINF